MKTLKDFEFKGKKVILRSDFNVSIKDGKIISNERITAELPTINYLIEKGAKVIIMSHLGKIKDEEDKKKNTLYIVYEELLKLINTKIIFSPATHGKILEEKISFLQNGEVLLMENTRYEDLENKKESNCDEELSRYWASLGDIFINDAFGMTHRKHASNYGINKFLPTGIGFLIENEIRGLAPIVKPQKPFTIIMSGAKLEDKLSLIKSLVPKCDKLLLGGGIANTFLAVNNNIGQSLASHDLISEAQNLISTFKERIIMPVDVKVKNDTKSLVKDISDITDNDIILDIGPKTLELYKKYISASETIFLNGTVGKYEEEGFEDGTKEILDAVSKTEAYSVIGGGDALSSAEYFKINDFSFISTGGGATLNYIATEKLACFEE
ncbi:MAG: phosphoglycerate kinase [Bacilli bacterium]|nr:phosphoglycerate kinase [Bacilli bacterium]